MKSIACAIAILALAVAALGQTGKQQLVLGKPVVSGSLAVIPILTTEKPNAGKYITLAEAARKGLVEIIEVPGREQVNSLQVRNKADLPLMLLAGELLIGGKQDRIVAKDFIIPPKGSAMVPVFCVEHGRWQPGGKDFKAGDTFVPDQIRTAAVMNDPAQKGLARGGQGSQAVVWDEVAKVNGRAEKAPATGTVRGTLDDPAIRQKVEALTTTLDRSVENSSRTVGMMVWLNGKVLSADLFANHALFDESRMKLLRSYAVDAYLAKSTKIVPLDMAACNKFLAEILNAKRDVGDRNGFGNIYQIKNGKILGYESGGGGFGGGAGGAGRAGFGHGTYKPGSGGG
jgi:hypothetical protein